MFDVGRMRIGVRALVDGIESAVIAVLGGWDIEAETRGDARGVYVGGRKIGAVGLRVRRGCAYHGLALNVAMDPEPFTRINPCGLVGMGVTQVSDLGGPADLDVARAALVRELALRFGFDPLKAEPGRWVRGMAVRAKAALPWNKHLPGALAAGRACSVVASSAGPQARPEAPAVGHC